ncbi:carbohydrate ABC transporter permease [Mahella australiensis]|uniref:Binding-protein-dependent transport systems inner membrane component n=1 Tax=Mahella australiensis (strain DSM 15567 / CIP 107919 / 50-1 BON) TaxID=697281 RepID=F3ZZ46_MAHA5|nr:carbohydrate ABC transporter permease [Mahella australiensis]AEE97828.1 binding-protein-dependent transport systems inner membrane component [Mahella australiensis 50-1 BON]
MTYTSTGYKIFKCINIILMIIVAVVMIFPYLNVLANAFNDGLDTAMGGITIFPRKPTLENFRVLLSDNSLTRAAVISVLRVLSGTVVALFVQFTAAYVFTKKDLWGRNGLLMFLIIPMFFNGGLIPQYLLYSKIGLLNNFLVYILPTAFSFYNMIIIRTYLNTIPDSLKESARLDGANEFVILARIILPLSMPIVATITLWTAVAHWNDWTTTLYFVTKTRLYTLQYILMQLLKESERIAKMMQEAQEMGLNVNNVQIRSTPEAIKAAQVVITTLPIIIVYPFLQKYFIKGVMIGAVKE